MESELKQHGVAVFLKAAFYTAAAIVLIVIGYFSTGYFFG